MLCSMASLLLLLLSPLLVESSPPAHLDALRYPVQEEVPVGTRVGNVVTDRGIRRQYGKDVLSQLEFRFLSEPSLPLVIGLNDGVIRTSGIIDREALPTCRQRETCEIPVDVTVQPVAYFQIIKIIVEVIDINDNSPRFVISPSMMAPPDHSSYQRPGESILPPSPLNPPTALISVLESVAVGSTFLLPSATDPDSPAFGVKRYDIVSTSNKFGLHVTEKLDGFLDVRLLLRQKLDRETVEEYRVRLFAFDGGQPAKTSAINVTIRVLDANDNDPVFDQTTYEVTIVENELPVDSKGHPRPIVRVHAKDADFGENGRVVYDFAPQTRAQLGRTFTIDNRTGDIYLRQAVDRERGSSSASGSAGSASGSVSSGYRLIVTAEDAGPDSHPVDATVLVAVADVNDNAPTIFVNTLAATGADSAEIPENTAPRTFVGHLTVSDRDAGQNGTVECELQVETAAGSGSGVIATVVEGPGTAFVMVERSLPQQTEKEYQLFTAISPDREAVSDYLLSITCHDYGDPPLKAVKRLPVHVTDENDNHPVFSEPFYTARITENNRPGAVVVQLNATDADVGENGTIARYVIVGGVETRLFSVSEKGQVIALVPLNREDRDSRRFDVLAIDAGHPPRTGTTQVVVTVEDVDDQLPVFTDDVYTFTVAENQPIGTPFGFVSATDADSPPGNAFRYTFASYNSATDCFHVDPSNGTLTTKCTLDRELQPVYYLTVAAVALTPPQALVPMASLRASSATGALSTRLAATGSTLMSSTASLVIYVSDLNDNDPTFIFPSSPFNDTVSVSNVAPVDHVVTRLLAHDPDDSVKTRLNYRLIEIREQPSTASDVDGGQLVGNGIKLVGPQLLPNSSTKFSTSSAPPSSTAPWFKVDPVVGTILVGRPMNSIDHRVFRLTVGVDDSAPFDSRSAVGHLTIIVNKSIPYVPQYTSLLSGSANGRPKSRGGVGGGTIDDDRIRSIGGTILAIGLGLVLFVIAFLIVVTALGCWRRHRGRTFCCRLKHRRHAQERRLVDKSNGSSNSNGNGKDIDGGGFEGGSSVSQRPGNIEEVKMLSPKIPRSTAVGDAGSALQFSSAEDETSWRTKSILINSSDDTNVATSPTDPRHSSIITTDPTVLTNNNNNVNTTTSDQQHSTQSAVGALGNYRTDVNTLTGNTTVDGVSNDIRYTSTMPRQKLGPGNSFDTGAGFQSSFGTPAALVTSSTTPWQLRSQFNSSQQNRPTYPSATTVVSGEASLGRPMSCIGRIPTGVASSSGSGPRCSYGVSSPCSKLVQGAVLQSTTSMTSSSSGRSVHFKNQHHELQHQAPQPPVRQSMTLPRGGHVTSGTAMPPPPPPPAIRRPVMTSLSTDTGNGNNVATTRLKPPPPPTSSTASNALILLQTEAQHQQQHHVTTMQMKSGRNVSVMDDKSRCVVGGSATGNTSHLSGGLHSGTSGTGTSTRPQPLSTIIV